MNCFCRAMLSAIGLMARFESSITARNAASQQPAPANSESTATVSMERVSTDTSRNTTMLPRPSREGAMRYLKRPSRPVFSPEAAASCAYCTASSSVTEEMREMSAYTTSPPASNLTVKYTADMAASPSSGGRKSPGPSRC